MSARNKNLKPNFEAAVDDYVNELLCMWSDYDKDDPAFSPFYGHWAGDDKSGVYCYEDCFFISLSDIIYCVENNVGYKEYQEWSEYCVECHEWNFTTPNLDAWHHGFKRVPQETFEKLRERRQQLEDLVEIVKHNPNIQI